MPENSRFFAFCTILRMCCVIPRLSHRKRMHGEGRRWQGGSLGVCMANEDAAENWEINYKPTRFYMCEDVERWMIRIFKKLQQIVSGWGALFLRGGSVLVMCFGWHTIIIIIIIITAPPPHDMAQHGWRTRWRILIVHFDWMEFCRGVGGREG